MMEDTAKVKLRTKLRTITVTVAEQELTLLYNVVAMAEVYRRYETLENLSEKLYDPIAGATEIPWLIALLANQFSALSDYENGTKTQPISAEGLALRMQPHDVPELIEAAINAINLGIIIVESADNEVDEVLNEVLASKNVTGAGER